MTILASLVWRVSPARQCLPDSPAPFDSHGGSWLAKAEKGHQAAWCWFWVCVCVYTMYV